MSTFQSRLAQAAALEEPFIETFNAQCLTHRIVKFGIESTHISELHQYIRSAQDVTSHFVRYLPDSVLVRLQDARDSIGPKTSLIEFKVQNTPVRSDGFFRRIQAEYGDANSPLTDKQDVFGMEKDALDVYRQIAGMGVRIVVVGYQRIRESEQDKIRAQYADNVVVCHTQIPSRLGVGSGTPLANTHFASFQPVVDFFQQEFGIHPDVLNAVATAIRH